MRHVKKAHKKPIVRNAILGPVEPKKGVRLSAFVFIGMFLIAGLVWAGVSLFSRDSQKSATISEQAYDFETIPAWWLRDYFGSSICDKPDCGADADPDDDKLTNAQEFYYSTNPLKKDSNDNGLSDGEDVALGYAPNKPGRVTFEEAESDENIIGESLLFNTEVKNVLVEMTDLNRVPLPEIKDSELNITEDVTLKAFTEYMIALSEVSKKYNNSSEIGKKLTESIKSQNLVEINEFKLTATRIREDYRKVTVPRNAVQLHKYHIALWGLIPSVLNVPVGGEQTVFGLPDDPVAEKWFDDVQTMYALNQKIEAELVGLRNSYR